MKLTLNIDDELLERVRVTTGAKTKTEAIHSALNELDRRHKLKELLALDDFGLTPEEWKNAWEAPEESAESSRVAETPTSATAAPLPRKEVKYERKPRSRR